MVEDKDGKIEPSFMCVYIYRYYYYYIAEDRESFAWMVFGKLGNVFKNKLKRYSD